MPCHDDECDDEDWGANDLDESEADEPPDDEDDDETVPCPYCGKPVYEEAERRPHCDTYISGEDAPPARKPWWIIVGAVVCLGIVYLWITSSQ